MADLDKLANEIRRVDGNNSLGAGALAEALWPFVQALARRDGVEEPVAWERRKAGSDWLPCNAEDVKFYRSVGQEVRALYAHPAPADPRPDPLEALREAQEQGSALVSAVLGGDKMEMLAAADAFNKGYPKRQKALAKIDAVMGEARRLAEFLLGRGGNPSIDLEELITKIDAVMGEAG
jgi:hypothetical protein